MQNQIKSNLYYIIRTTYLYLQLYLQLHLHLYLYDSTIYLMPGRGLLIRHL